jgi:hypothetical protein
MFQDSMIGLAKIGMRIACNLMERGFGGHRRHGSPELPAAWSIHGQVCGAPTLCLGELS